MSPRRGGAPGDTQPETTVHRGVKWRREGGVVSFYDQSSKKWVRWATGVDAPPLPPRWQLLGVPTKVTRPGWRSPWRIVPIVLVAVAVVVAVVQSLTPSGGNTAKEAKASAALLGKCLARNGTLDGHPRYSATPVACGTPGAAAKVVAVLPTTPGSPVCPSATTGMELAYPGVAHPHVECIQPLPG